MIICSVDGCDNRAVARKLCEKHYRRYQRYGDPLILMRQPGPRRKCLVKGCIELAAALGFCTVHYQRYQKWGDPTFLTYRRTPSPYPKGEMPAICTIDDCDRRSKALGLCRVHYYRQKEYGSGPNGYQDCPVCRKRRYRISTGHEMCGDCWKLAIRRTVIRICQPNGFWTKQSCLDAGREWVNSTGYLPLYDEWINLDHLRFPSRGVIADRFGAWSRYIDALDSYIKRTTLRERAAAYWDRS